MIRVDRGSHVRAGEVIIRLSAPELAAQRAQGEANVQTAQSQFSAVKRSFPPTRELTSIWLRQRRLPAWSQATTCWLPNRPQPRIVRRYGRRQITSQAAEDALRSVKQLESVS